MIVKKMFIFLFIFMTMMPISYCDTYFLFPEYITDSERSIVETFSLAQSAENKGIFVEPYLDLLQDSISFLDLSKHSYLNGSLELSLSYSDNSRILTNNVANGIENLLVAYQAVNPFDPLFGRIMYSIVVIVTLILAWNIFSKNYYNLIKKLKPRVLLES